MKLGIDTILWGPEIRRPETLFTQLRRMGFGAIEIAQHPSALLRVGLNANRLKGLLQDLDMTLLGMIMGSLEERVAYCADFLKPVYYYVERVELNISKARELDVALALHAHVFKPTARLADARCLLKRYPALLWIPDTAHQFIAGDSPVEAVNIVPDERMPAVHIKDWSSLHSRSSHRYPRGFCDLGHGDVPVRAVLETLSQRSYNGVLVFEQNYPQRSVKASLKSAADFLDSFGLTLDTSVPIEPRIYPSIDLHGMESRSVVQDEISRHFALPPGTTLADFYDHTAWCLAKNFAASKVMIWSVNPTHPILTLVGLYPANLLTRDTTISRSRAMCSIALERHEACVFDLRQITPGSEFGNAEAEVLIPEILDDQDRALLAIPVSSPYNHNHERLVCAIVCHDTPAEEYVRKTALGLAETIALSADRVLDYLCSCMANAAQAAVAGSTSPAEFARRFCRFVEQNFRAEAVSLFVEDEDEDVLNHVYTTTHLIWHVRENERFYRRGEGLTGLAWARVETFNTAYARPSSVSQARSSEQVRSRQEASLILPLAISPSRAIGVLRCQNKLVDSGPRSVPFNDDDAAMMESAAAAVTPQLQILLQQKRSNDALVRLTHELLSPFPNILGAVLTLERDLKAAKIDPQQILWQDYLSDINTFVQHFFRLVKNINLFGREELRPQFEGGPYYLLADVVAPAVSQLQAYLRETRGSTHPISYSGFEDVPKLWIDKEYFQQVIFNLLTNAIKYSFQDPTALAILISAGRDRESYTLTVSNYGMGVPEAFREAIFRKHVRTSEAKSKDPKGQGIGLWITRRIVEVHGGSIILTSLSTPTTFLIRLPFTLEGPPKVTRKRR